MNQKFKLSIIFSLISGFILLVLGIVGVVYFASQERFILFFDEYLNQPTSADGTTLNDLLSGLVDMDYFMPMMYIMFMGYSIFNIISAIVCLVLSFICLNDHHLSCKAFQSRKALHIVYIVFVGISWFSIECSVGSLISSLLVLLSTVASVLYIIAFIFGIIGVRYNTKRLAELYSDEDPFKNMSAKEFNEGTEKLMKSLFSEDQNELQEDDFNQEELSDERKQELQEEKFNETEKVEEKPVVDNKKLNETYELLAKLEKSHRNQEISDEDYVRMKKTIMDNLTK